MVTVARVCRSGIRIPGGWQFRDPTIRYNSDYFVKNFVRILNELVKGTRGWKFALEGKDKGKRERDGERAERPRCRNARDERGKKKNEEKEKRNGLYIYKLLACGRLIVTNRDTGR